MREDTYQIEMGTYGPAGPHHTLIEGKGKDPNSWMSPQGESRPEVAEQVAWRQIGAMECFSPKEH